MAKNWDDQLPGRSKLVKLNLVYSRNNNIIGPIPIPNKSIEVIKVNNEHK